MPPVYADSERLQLGGISNHNQPLLTNRVLTSGSTSFIAQSEAVRRRSGLLPESTRSVANFPRWNETSGQLRVQLPMLGRCSTADESHAEPHRRAIARQDIRRRGWQRRHPRLQ